MTKSKTRGQRVEFSGAIKRAAANSEKLQAPGAIPAKLIPAELNGVMEVFSTPRGSTPAARRWLRKVGLTDFVEALKNAHARGRRQEEEGENA